MKKNISKSRSTEELSYTVLYESIRDKGFQVTVPLLPGLVTFGRTFNEAREMARDAIRCYIEALKEGKEFVPRENSLLQERMTIKIT